MFSSNKGRPSVLGWVCFWFQGHWCKNCADMASELIWKLQYRHHFKWQWHTRIMASPKIINTFYALALTLSLCWQCHWCSFSSIISRVHVSFRRRPHWTPTLWGLFAWERGVVDACLECQIIRHILPKNAGRTEKGKRNKTDHGQENYYLNNSQANNSCN